MTKRQVVGSLICVFWATSGIADSEASSSLRKRACSIELSRLKSPHDYIVALVDRGEQAKCDDNECVATLAVAKVFAAGDHSAQLTSISVTYSVKTRDNGFPYPKGRSFGVFVPASNGKGYGWLAVTYGSAPGVDSSLIADYEEAVSIVSPSSTGAPHCEKRHAP